MFSQIVCVTKKHLTYQHAFPRDGTLKQCKLQLCSSQGQPSYPRMAKHGHAIVPLQNKTFTA